MSIALGYYRHFRGNRYRVLGTVRHSETVEPMVLYQALYDERGLWVRPAAMFEEMVDVDGAQVPRFAYEGAADDIFARMEENA